MLFYENPFSIYIVVLNKVNKEVIVMEATFGGVPIAEKILLVLMLAMLLVLWGTIMYQMGKE